MLVFNINTLLKQNQILSQTKKSLVIQFNCQKDLMFNRKVKPCILSNLYKNKKYTIL